MKIAIVADPFFAIPPEKYGGRERIIHFLIKGLTENGHEITLLAPGDSKVPCKLIPICEKHTSRGKDVKENIKVEKQVAAIRLKSNKILKSILNEIDIIHSHSHGFDMKDFQNFPNITTLHSPFVFSNLNFFKERKELFYASISKNQQMGFPDLSYVEVCYNGLDPDEFPFVEKPKDYICFIGRFDDEKNPHLAIELAIKLGVKIKIAGKVDYQGIDYFERVIRPYLKNPLVEYVGELGFEDKINLISNARVNLHPTGFREPFGLTVLESAYCGTPTLAINKGSMPELIEDGRTGLLVEDFVEGYHHIDQLYGMDRQYISQRARNLFNYKTMTKQYETAYKKVLTIFDSRKKMSQKTIEMKKNTEDILNGAIKS